LPEHASPRRAAGGDLDALEAQFLLDPDCSVARMRERVAEPLSSGFDGVARRLIQPERKTSMTAKDKIARRKLSLLELASDLANVSRACKLMGYSRQQFYEIRRNFQTYGAEGA
jgi:Homeodomain-like domain